MLFITTNNKRSIWLKIKCKFPSHFFKLVKSVTNVSDIKLLLNIVNNEKIKHINKKQVPNVKNIYFINILLLLWNSGKPTKEKSASNV